MGIYETELGYQVRETLNGLEVTDPDEDKVVCTLNGNLNYYREDPDDELSDIDDDMLEADIKKVCEAQEFLDYQREYC